MTLKDVAKLAYRTVDQLGPDVEPGLEATVSVPADALPDLVERRPTCAWWRSTADTWLPKVLRYIVSEDCGRMINPRIVEGQIFGGVVQGIGGVCSRTSCTTGTGNPLTTTFLDYLLPTASDVPDIEVGHIETVSSTNPGGFKGMGEGGAIGAHAAVANAIGDALVAVRGAGHPDAPRPERYLRARLGGPWISFRSRGTQPAPE